MQRNKVYFSCLPNNFGKKILHGDKKEMKKDKKNKKNEASEEKKPVQQEEKKPEARGELVRRASMVGFDFEIEVSLPDGQSLSLYDTIVEHCAKDLSNKELKAVYESCNAQIKAMDPDDVPFQFYELMDDLHTAVVNRAINVRETFVPPAKVKELLDKKKDKTPESEEKSQTPSAPMQTDSILDDPSLLS